MQISTALIDHLRQAINNNESLRELVASLLSIGTTSFEATALLNAIAPSNVYPLDAFAAEAVQGVVIPTDGDYLARFVAPLNTEGEVLGGGSFLSNAIAASFTLNGTGNAVGNIAIQMPAFGVMTTPIQSWTVERLITGLKTGDVIGLDFGFLGARAAQINIQAGRTISITRA